MTEREQIEILAEEFYRQLNELRHWRSKDLKDVSKLDTIISNLASCYNALYSFFEDMPIDNIDENKIFREILSEKLTHQEKVDIKIRNGIEI